MKYLLLLIPLLLLSCEMHDYEEAAMFAEFTKLIEQQEIIETCNLLFINTDNREWEAVKKIFTDNVHFDVSSMGDGEPSMLTSQQIVYAWDEGLKGLEQIHHQAGNYVVTVQGNGADVFCYAIATHY